MLLLRGMLLSGLQQSLTPGGTGGPWSSPRRIHHAAVSCQRLAAVSCQPFEHGSTEQQLSITHGLLLTCFTKLHFVVNPALPLVTFAAFTPLNVPIKLSDAAVGQPAGHSTPNLLSCALKRLFLVLWAHFSWATQ